MSKTVLHAASDFKKDIVSMINSSQLPLILTEYIMDELLREIRKVNSQQLSADIQNYNDELAAAKEEEQVEE